MDKEIQTIMNALESCQTGIVNDYLFEKWNKDINLFIETVATMRKQNPSLADNHFNSSEFIQQFSFK
jgi:hypothetical protein